MPISPRALIESAKITLVRKIPKSIKVNLEIRSILGIIFSMGYGALLSAFGTLSGH